jgi:hypothetical protein
LVTDKKNVGNRQTIFLGKCIFLSEILKNSILGFTQFKENSRAGQALKLNAQIKLKHGEHNLFVTSS